MNFGQKLSKLADSLGAGINKDEFKLKDVLNSGDLSKLVPLAISEVVREASEFDLLAPKLFTRLNVKEGIYISLPALGALDGVEEVAPGQEYGTEEITMGGGTTIRIDIRKYGLKIAATEEMIENSQWDIITAWLRAAGKAFARKKNRICLNLFETQGLTLVDNSNPRAGILGRTLTGRGVDGANNGSFDTEDFFDIYTGMLQQGFAPDTIVMHPLTWGLWVKDPWLRALALVNGSGPIFNAYNVGGTNRETWFGGMGKSSGGADPGEDVPPDFKGRPILPSFGMNVGFNIIVSPQVRFDPINQTSSIYFVDSQNAGALIQKEEINQTNWADPERDIYQIKLREKYGIAMLNEGKGVGVVKNVPLKPNRIVVNPVVAINNTDLAGTFPEDMPQSV